MLLVYSSHSLSGTDAWGVPDQNVVTKELVKRQGTSNTRGLWWLQPHVRCDLGCSGAGHLCLTGTEHKDRWVQGRPSCPRFNLSSLPRVCECSPRAPKRQQPREATAKEGRSAALVTTAPQDSLHRTKPMDFQIFPCVLQAAPGESLPLRMTRVCLSIKLPLLFLPQTWFLSL